MSLLFATVMGGNKYIKTTAPCYDVQVRRSLLVHGGSYSVGYPPVVEFLYGSLVIPFLLVGAAPTLCWGCKGATPA